MPALRDESKSPIESRARIARSFVRSFARRDRKRSFRPCYSMRFANARISLLDLDTRLDTFFRYVSLRDRRELYTVYRDRRVQPRFG